MQTIAFARGVPAPEMLPIEDLRVASQRAFEQDPVKLLSYGTGAGWDPLRARLAAQHEVDVARVVVTTGSLEGFALLAQVIARRAAAEGRIARVIVEQPTYDRPLLILRRLGIEVVPVPLDPDGIDVAAFAEACAAGADLAYLIPTFQNPSGATLDVTRRAAVIDVAKRSGVLLLEDDPYGVLHFDEPAPQGLFAGRGDAPVAFSGSFSKTIAPGVRVGWLVLPQDLALEVATLANDTYISASFLGQATVDAYLEAGAFQGNVDRARSMLAERCSLIVDAFARHLPEATFTAPRGGYFIWVRMPDGLDATDVLSRATGLGVSFVAGSSFGADCGDYARLAFSSPPVDQIDEGVARLAAACESRAAVR
ncbi:MAG: putative transcriptional regulator, GntR family [Thermoleophilia bacterium]|nr:putative transcriptional regulator, GntR family [Thermoleophilia bacterium]